MEYISAYYRSERSGLASAGKRNGDLDGRASVVLQQVKCGRLPVFFAWVCGEEAAGAYRTEEKAETGAAEAELSVTGEDSAGAYMTGRLIDWFYKKALVLCKRGSWKEMQALEKSLTGEMARIEEELSLWQIRKGEKGGGMLASAAGILCVGSLFLLCSRGRQRTYVVNTRFLRPNLRLLTGESGQWQVRSGVLQPGIGIVLGTESFYRGLTEEMVRECLELGALSDELRLEKRLRELGKTDWTETTAGTVGATAKATSEDGENAEKEETPEGKGAVLFCIR